MSVTDIGYIADLLRLQDRDRYLTALLAPAAVRVDLMTLYAINAELARIRGAVSEAMIGRIKLQWWRDVVAGVYEGRGAPKGNPLTDGMAAIVDRHQLTRTHFDALIDTRERDMSGAEDDGEPPTLEGIESYAEGTSVSVVRLALEILGEREGAAVAAGRHVGIAYALVGLLRAVAFEVRAGGVRTPILVAAPASALVETTRQMAALAAGHMESALSFRGGVLRRAIPALLLNVMVAGYLKQLSACGSDPFHPRLDASGVGVWSLTWHWLCGRY